MDSAAPPAVSTLTQEEATLRSYVTALGDLALAGELPPEHLLQRIVDTARALLHARYAALGVFDRWGRVEQFLTSGISREEQDRIGTPPRGEGLLGLIVRERRIIRAPRIAEHPASAGFPPNHPPMTSFLGGPIMRGDVIYGNLYLTDRVDAEEFSPSDEALLALFAGQAAMAIENARRLAQAHQEEQTILSLFEIGRDLASLREPRAVMELVAREARRLLEADVSGLGLREPDGQTLRWMLVQGSAGRFQADTVVPIQATLVGQVLEAGTPFQSEDIQELPLALQNNPLLKEAQVRGVLIVPLGYEAGARGVMVVGWRAAGTLPQNAQRLLERLADRAAIALAQAELSSREQTALRQAQMERSSLEVIFDSMLDAVFTTDLEGRITRLNRRASALAALPNAAALGRPAEEVFPLVDAVGRPAAGIDAAGATSGEVYLRLPRGDQIPVDRVLSPIRGVGGQTLGMVQVLRDLRAQREVEQLKATIISLVSHELRTPLSHIKGYASTLLQPDVEWDPATQRDFITSIERQADRLGRLISDILEISRLDAGGAAQLERVPIAPATLVERGVGQASPNANGHVISLAIADGLPPVLADPGHIERVLSNLIENAAKYSPDGAPISVEVEQRANAVEFAVRDRGTGLTEEEQRHLFERFYRSPRVKHRTPGTGLGLAICKEIVEAHGGTITAESGTGIGSVFRFTLPRSD